MFFLFFYQVSFSNYYFLYNGYLFIFIFTDFLSYFEYFKLKITVYNNLFKSHYFGRIIMKKGILILTLLILALFSMSCIYAADAEDAIAISEDAEAMGAAQSDEMTASDDSNAMEQSDDEELILEDNDVDKPILGEGASTGSFTDLNDLINNQYYSNDTITLSCNYTFNGTDDDDSGFIHGININRGVTIDGNGCTIDGSQKARIFNIGDSGSVKFLNINFINGKATGSGLETDGGAIIAMYRNCVVECCNFTNNTADSQGGALMRVTAHNCTFTGNKARMGGAIAQGDAYNSIFTGNTANDNGGAINFGSAYNCVFTGNTAERDGGAIYYGSAYNCTFTGNHADRDGGAIAGDYDDPEYCSATLCMFDSNTPDDYRYICIVNVVLSADDLTTSYNSGDRLLFNLTADNTNYVGFNTTIKIYQDEQEIGTYYALSGEGWIVDLSPGTYKAVLSLDKYEGVTNGTATITITDGTTFWDLNNLINASSSDTVTLDRNYAYNPITDYDFKDGIIINRMVTIIGGDYSIDAKGQARIFNIHADKATIRNVTFINANATDYGGALYWNGVNVTVFDCLFVNNSAGISGGAIYWRDGADTNVSGCIFVNNTAENGGAVTVGDGVVSGCSFVNNSAEYGGAVILAGGTLSGCSFVNNSAYICGAVSLEDGTVSGCSFVNNTADNDGGAIVWSTTEWSSNRGYVFDCSFENNRAGSDGGAILWLNGANGVVSDCIFVNNSASDEGGAILWSHNDNANISGCSFANNTAGSDGGAIYLKFSANGVVYDCSFVNNSARYGGAIEWHQSDNGNISTCIFVNNSDERAVIFFYNMGSGHGLSINNNIFLNNNASAISFILPDSSSNADYNWFGHNATDYETQPATSNVAINNWLFLNATATPDSILIFQSSDIIFRLYSYSESEGVSDYDNAKLPAVNLTLKATKGDTVGIAKFDELIRYFAMDFGTGTVTGEIENVQYTIEITNEKADLNLSVETSQVIYSNNTTIALSYNPNATGKVNITLKSKRFEYTFVDVDLNPSVSLGDIAAEEYEIIIQYSGDGNFTNSTARADLKVDKVNSTLIVSDVTLDYGTGTTLTVTTEGTLAITAIINGEETFVKGNIILIPAMDAGTYNLTVTAIPDDNHNAVTKTVTITVNKLKTQIAANAVTATYNINKYLTITLKDAKGKALSGVKVTVNLNGAKTYATDKNGQIKISTKGLAPKTYTAKIAFSGNKNYLKSAKNTKITVKKAKPKLTAKNKKFKRSKKVKKYTVVLKSNVGKPLKKVKLTIKIKGKKYKKTFKAKTNNKGKATFKIKKLSKKGKYKATVTYKGNKNYNKVTKKVKITIK